MRIDIISIVPELLNSFFDHSIIKRAKQKGLVEVELHHLRQYTTYAHGQVDDYMYGGGAGLVMMPEPVANVINHLKAQRDYDEVIYMSPDGVLFDQPMANRLALKGNLIILCGHYKGLDERIRQTLVTMEISIGNFVLSGGELPAATIADAVIRLVPGVLNDETSALTDSFQDNLLAPPVYTRPPVWEGHAVPDILLSGNHAKIEDWRFEQSLERTKERRPELYKKYKQS